MIKKFKNLLIVAASVAALLSPAVVPAIANAQAVNIGGNLCAGTNLNYGSTGGCGSNAGQGQLNKILHLVINLFSLIVGAVSVIMIIVGGLKYITSGGESNNITSAKNTIVFAIVGLVIVALAQFIVHFVLGKVASTV
jgi:cytochrome bd-type quinol oxidase subunit 2